MYRLIYELAGAAVERFPLLPTGAAEALRERRAATARWVGRTGDLGGDRPIWIHAASVGEHLVAEPIVRRLCQSLPEIAIVRSWTSPSAARTNPSYATIYGDFLPPDTPGTMSRVLDAVQPRLIVNARGDLWPNFVHAAAAQAIPVAVIGGQIRPDSLRLRWPARTLYASVMSGVSWIGATTPDDAGRWVRLGARPDVVTVTGDPRHDEVLERPPGPPPALEALKVWADGGPMVVAGSVEEADVAILIAAAAQLLVAIPTARVAIVPHEPTAGSVQNVQRRGTAVGIQIDVWRVGDPPPRSPCAVVAQRGILFDLYGLAALAYVGGGFRRGRLHAAIEPAARGVPVIVGPEWATSPDAAMLVGAGGATALSSRASVGELLGRWIAWCSDPTKRNMVGSAARAVIPVGAADRTAAALLPYLR